ncbi:hypothetical protein D9758_003486 [Tetrapyrgos nigripes]|uniref:Uncharacterized protein n=1 Tax=Tetrapyrgos nigripes TaxID=182062 RepID=A0A8H5GVG5_9AGAR|nr:hypothetical protein D9758_003486 [Tetrapyrgos nigripes]
MPVEVCTSTVDVLDFKSFFNCLKRSLCLDQAFQKGSAHLRRPTHVVGSAIVQKKSPIISTFFSRIVTRATSNIHGESKTGASTIYTVEPFLARAKSAVIVQAMSEGLGFFFQESNEGAIHDIR